jgi:transcriptional regulator with XRE-family HTH domain
MYRLTKIREEKQLSKTELSRRSGVALSVICQIEKQRLYPCPKHRRLLAEALNTNEEILFQEVPNEKN